MIRESKAIFHQKLSGKLSKFANKPNLNVNLNTIIHLERCKSGDYTFRPTGLLSGECYYQIQNDGTFKEAVATCKKNNCQLPVPTSMEENEFIGSLGSTFLGIRGDFDDGVVTWNNIYTQVRINHTL